MSESLPSSLLTGRPSTSSFFSSSTPETNSRPTSRSAANYFDFCRPLSPSLDYQPTLHPTCSQYTNSFYSAKSLEFTSRTHAAPQGDTSPRQSISARPPMSSSMERNTLRVWRMLSTSRPNHPVSISCVTPPNKQLSSPSPQNCLITWAAGTAISGTCAITGGINLFRNQSASAHLNYS